MAADITSPLQASEKMATLRKKSKSGQKVLDDLLSPGFGWMKNSSLYKVVHAHEHTHLQTHTILLEHLALQASRLVDVHLHPLALMNKK